MHRRASRLHSREVLEEDAGGEEGHFDAALLAFPVQDVHHILPPQQKAVTISHSSFQQDPYGERQDI